METQQIRVLLIDGSASSPSRVAKLLETIAEHLKAQGCETTILELHALNLPVNDPKFHNNPENHPNQAVKSFVAAVKETDIVVLGTPLYHGSYSGLLKLALDHLHDDAFRGKVVGLASNATGERNALQAAQDLVLIARTMKGDVLNKLVGTCQADYGVKDGIFQIIEPEIVSRIEAFAAELTTHARFSSHKQG